MAFLQTTNAETGIYSAEGWDRVLSGWEVVRDNSVAHAGSWSWLVAGDGLQKGSGWLLPAYVSGRWFLVRFWVRIAALPTGVVSLGLAPSNGSSVIADLQVNTDGTLQTAAGANFPTNKSAALAAGVWNKLEFAGRFEASASYNWVNAIWRLNNVEFQRYCARPAHNAVNKMYAGTNFSAPHINVDDMVLNDDTGSSANYWNDGTKPLSTGKTKPSVRSVGTTVTNTVAANSIVVNAPSSIASGDTLTMVVEFAIGNPGTITLPSGWAQRTATFGLSSGGGILIATKIATGSEPSTYTVSWPGAGGLRGHSVCYALAGVNASPVLDAQSVTVTVSNTDSSFMLPALDLSEGDALILQAASITEASATKALTNPAAWTSATNVADNTNGQALACGVFGQNDGGLTATGLMSATANISGSVTVAAIAFRAGAPPQSIVPTGIASAQAFGTPVVGRGAVSVAPTGIASAQALGTPRVGAGISPSGISSAQAFGGPTVVGSAVSIAPGGIPTAQAFGTARITLFLIPSGIASAQAFGTPAAGITRAFHPLGIPSAQAFGRPHVSRKRTTTVVLLPAGIASAQAFGLPIVSRGAVTIVPVGIASAEVVGLGGIGRPVIVPKPTGTGALSLMLIRRSGLRH